MANRSIPIPAAIAVLILILAVFKTLLCNIPAPKISIQPVCLHIEQPLP
jgi:hypothetical protein